jgi:hypothetical protein
MQVHKLVVATAIALSVATVQAEAADRLIHHSIDRSSGAIVRVFKTESGNRVEVETPALRVQREMAGTKIVTTIRENSQDLTVSFDRGVLMVVTPTARVRAQRDQPDRLEAARELIASSPSVRHALSLIQRLGFGPNTPVLPLLVTTKAFLATVLGQPASQAIDRSWTTPASSGARIVKASTGVEQSQSPTDCWNAYAKEAIAAWIELEDCVKDLRWYEFLDQAACSVIYDMRAIGAFSWWMKCVALN